MEVSRARRHSWRRAVAAADGVPDCIGPRQAPAILWPRQTNHRHEIAPVDVSRECGVSEAAHVQIQQAWALALVHACRTNLGRRMQDATPMHACQAVQGSMHARRYMHAMFGRHMRPFGALLLAKGVCQDRCMASCKSSWMVVGQHCWMTEVSASLLLPLLYLTCNPRSKFADGFPNLFVDKAIDIRNKVWVWNSGKASHAN
eukprot:357211-Chlamydomonas_euryale.AAC.5